MTICKTEGCDSARKPGHGNRYCEACAPLRNQEARARARDKWESKKRALRPTNHPCLSCGTAVPRSATGRPKRVCSAACVLKLRRASHAATRARTKEKRREAEFRRTLRTKYGMTPEQKEELLSHFGGLCRICLEPPTSAWGPVVDHNHATGDVRGVLCSNYNAALGQFKDDPERCKRAAEYLMIPFGVVFK